MRLNGEATDVRAKNGDCRRRQPRNSESLAERARLNLIQTLNGLVGQARNAVKRESRWDSASLALAGARD